VAVAAFSLPMISGGVLGRDEQAHTRADTSKPRKSRDSAMVGSSRARSGKRFQRGERRARAVARSARFCQQGAASIDSRIDAGPAMVSVMAPAASTAIGHVDELDGRAMCLAIHRDQVRRGCRSPGRNKSLCLDWPLAVSR